MATTPDHPGPHPENQRKRAELRGPRHALIGVAALAAIAAFISPLAHVRGPTPLFAVVIGVTQAIAAFLLVGHFVRARMVALLAALLAVGWSAVYGMTHVGDGYAFPLALFGVGALEVLLVAGCTPRDAGKKKRMSMRAPRRA